MEMILSRQHTVQLSEVGPDSRLCPVVLMNFFQNIANEHATALGFGFEDLTAKQMAWFARSYHITILNYPMWQQAITIRTWPSDQKRLLCLRDFEILDSSGGVLISASSSWMVINTKTKRPLRPDRDFKEFVYNRKRALDTEFDDIPDLTGCDFENIFTPRFGEIDLNRHINSAVYLSWAIETMPADFLWDHFPCQIEIAFLSELFFENVVLAKTQFTQSDPQPTAIHLICDRDTQTPAARLKTTWKAK